MSESALSGARRTDRGKEGVPDLIEWAGPSSVVCAVIASSISDGTRAALTTLACSALFVCASDGKREAADLFQQASQMFLKANYGQAAQLLEQAVSLDDSDSRPIRLLGICYQLTGDLDRAERAFVRASEAHPKDAEARFYLARVYYLQNFFEKALRVLETAKRLRAHDVRVLELMALSHEAISDTGRALTEYAEAVVWNAKSEHPLSTPHLNYGVLLHKLSQDVKSERELRRAKALDPKAWEPPFELAKLYAGQGKLEAAIRELRIASQSSTAKPQEMARVYRLLAQFCSQTGRDEESKRALAAAAKLED